MAGSDGAPRPRPVRDTELAPARMIDRRDFIRMSAVAGTVATLAPFAAACSSSGGAIPVVAPWIPDSISGLDVHFDAMQLLQPVVAWDHFLRPESRTLGVASSGEKWTQTGNLALTRSGVAMESGPLATALIPARKQTQTSVAVSLRPGEMRTAFCVILETADGAQHKILFSRSATQDLVEFEGASATSAESAIRTGLVPGVTNAIRVDIQPHQVIVLSNGSQVMSHDLAAAWDITSYGFGFRDGDSESVLQSFMVRDLDDVVLFDHESVSAIPQLAQPSRCLQASQDNPASQPTFAAVGRRPALFFDGKSTALLSNATADGHSFTVFAVLQRNRSAGGTIIGSNHRDGGVQLRINNDGSVMSMNSGQSNIAASRAGVVDDTPAIVAFSLDSGGIGQLYVDGRPVAASESATLFPPGANMSIGSTFAGEFFAGYIFEILRWNRPLSAVELRSAFAGLGEKWSITVDRAISDTTQSPFGAIAVKGSNIIPSKTDLSNEPGASAWLNLWSRWDWKWIERSVKRSVDQGANTIRLIGDVNAVQTGTISEATYHDRLEQVTQLCADNRCQFYYCAIDLRHKRDASPEFIAQFLGGIGSVLARHTNVMAIDLCNEVASAYALFPEDQVVTWVSSWSKAIRETAPDIPLSISDVSTGGLLEKLAASRYYDLYADAVDFFDVHVYDGARVSSDSEIMAPYELYVDRPLLIGEFGADRLRPTANPALLYSQVRAFRNSSPKIVGAVQWGAVQDEFGLYSETDDRLQSDIAPEWAQF